MINLRETWARFFAFFRRDALDRDFDEELAAHMEMATDEYVRQGLPPDEARRRALARLGGVETSKHVHRETRGLPSLDALLVDLRHAVRGLRRNPGFALTAVATLAVAIGINTAVFSIADAVLFKGFRLVGENDRILYVGTQRDGRGCCVSYPDFLDWRATTRAFTDLGTVADRRIAYVDDRGFPESRTATLITANTFRILGQAPLAGRDFTPDDEKPGAAPVAILSHGFWERRYAGDAAVIGRTVRVNNTPTLIIGVMPRGFAFPQNQDLWMPLVPTPDRQERDARGLWFAFGRLADGVTREQARAELAAIGAQLALAYPDTNEKWIPREQTFTEFFVGRDAATTYTALWGAVVFVLLIACGNLSTLVVGRSLARTRETSVRLALGSGRWRIVRQHLVESLVLAAAGGVAGWWLAVLALRAYAAVVTPPTQAWAEGLLDLAIDARVLAYLVAMSLFSGVLAGVAPALRLSRLDLNHSLKDGGRGSAGSARQRRLSRFVITGEVALAIVLLAGAAVMIRSFVNISTADPGFDADAVVTTLILLPPESYPDGPTQMAFLDRLAAKLEAAPGIESVALGTSGTNSGTMTPYEVSGVSSDGPDRLSAAVSHVGPGYFQTLGTAVLSGREFEAADGAPGRPVAVVNERMARLSWPGEDPIGRQVRLFDGPTPGAWLTVVGVVANIQWDVSRERERIEPRVYIPHQQRPAPGAWIFARSHLPVSSLATVFRHELQQLDPNLPLWSEPYTLADRLSSSGIYWNIGSHAALFALFAAIALFLASVGLYAIVAHSVTQRTQEIGVRLAMGGTARDILSMIVGEGMQPIAVGLTLGLAAAVALTRVLSAELVDVSPVDPLALAGASAVLVIAALVGCLIPARRAARVDPVVALRHE
ncbi:MAG: ABC transporter permease, partial [Acidobacteria bacterium]|nr:ABC transporter permease [Acidobacteriota bacterium]